MVGIEAATGGLDDSQGWLTRERERSEDDRDRGGPVASRAKHWERPYLDMGVLTVTR